MIAVKALYEQGNVKFLEPTPSVEHAMVVVVFLDARGEDALRGLAWGERMDEVGAQTLVAMHEELAPCRAEAEQAYLNREETSP
jgi:hypothetical protein